MPRDETSSRRVLVLSAPVGEGHVAAARTLAARMRVLWPAARVDEVESVGGQGRTRLLRAAYAWTMRWAPGLYGLGYDLLVRVPATARLFRRLAARGTGRRLDRLIPDDPAPDLIVSTYPISSGGLAWLRGRGRLPGRAVAVVTDAAVHPFWVWPELDETWALTPTSAAQARRFCPDVPVRVAPAAVGPAFVAGEQGPARAATGLPAEAFTVVVSGGSLGFGAVERVTEAALALGEDTTVVALCGRHTRLAARLRAGARGAGRLVALEWTDRVPELLTAADVVVTTGGGVMATEALAVGRPVVFAAPVAGHGRAGAETMAAEGLAVLCRRPRDVTAALARLRPPSDELDALSRRAAEFSAGDLDAALDGLAHRL